MNNSRLNSAKSTANNSRISSAKSTTMKSRNFNLGDLDAEQLLKHAARLSQKRPEWVDRW
jgi:hypothetical protein